MEHDSKPTKKKRGSSPGPTTEEIYHAWLKRPPKGSSPAVAEEPHGKKTADPASDTE